ncbi:MAG: hypothetical protein PWP40_3125, partial [Rhodocyclaceae bacterium]|nr:hypothetical protein [Rhodocyclaceae bacterium]
VHDPDRHHLDRHPQRHRRRGRARRAARAVAADPWHGAAHQRDRLDRAGRGGDHLRVDRGRRAGPQAHRPDRPGRHRPHGGAADERAVDRLAPLRASAGRLDRAAAAPDGPARAWRAERDRGGDPRHAGRGLRGGRDREERARHGAQRVPPRRPPDRLADGAALGHRRARPRPAAGGEPRAGGVLVLLQLPGVPRRAGRDPRHRQRQEDLHPDAARGTDRSHQRAAAGRVRAGVADRHGAARPVPRLGHLHGVRDRRVRRGAGHGHPARRDRVGDRRVPAARHRGGVGGAARGWLVAARRPDPDRRAQGPPRHQGGAGRGEGALPHPVGHGDVAARPPAQHRRHRHLGELAAGGRRPRRQAHRQGAGRSSAG